MKNRLRIFHYPWRYSLAPEDIQALPVPSAGHVSPEIGAFYCREGKETDPEELCAPSMEEGRGRDECTASDGKRFWYDQDCVHQYRVESVDSEIRRGHFALSDAGISLSALLYKEREKRGHYFYEMSLSKACELFQEYLKGAKDFASASLIYEIAENTISAIENIVFAPRKVLTRVHREVPIARVQEFDTKALLDYARRPGRNAPMKAGAKQKLLGVVREESPDTPENRVVLDFIWRAESAAVQYGMEMRERCPEHNACTKKECDGCKSERLRVVLHFIRKCEAWKCAENFRGVQRLGKPFTRANYVLQQNARYVQVWRYYLKLLAQENVEGEIWQWQRRAFADLMRMVMMCVWVFRLKTKSKGDGDVQMVRSMSKRPFMIREQNDRGGWLASDPFEEALVFKVGREESRKPLVTLYVLNEQEAVRVLKGTEIAKLNADFYWIAMREGHVAVCPVWCLCPDKKWSESHRDGEHERKALCEIRALCTDYEEIVQVNLSQGWILSPGGGDEDEREIRDGGYLFLKADIFRRFEWVLDVLTQELERMLWL